MFVDKKVGKPDRPMLCMFFEEGVSIIVDDGTVE